MISTMNAWLHSLFGWRVPLMEPRHIARIQGQNAIAAILDARFTPAHVKKAAHYWSLGILEPGETGNDEASPKPAAIDDIIRNDKHGAWGWLDAYTRDGQTSWCGHFVAACFGPALPRAVRQRVMASTSRLLDHHAAHGILRLPSTEAIPGDVLVVKHHSSKKRAGDHITLVEYVDHKAGLIHTIEGNARGLVPGGARGDKRDAREGVVRRTRPIGRANASTCPVSGLPQSSGAFAIYRITPRD